MKKTRYPGVTRLGEGRYRIRVQQRTRPGTPGKEVDRVVECKTIHEALVKRQELQAALETRATNAGGRGGKVVTRAYATWWLASKAIRLAHSTADRYATALDLHLLPEFGDELLPLSRTRVETWMAAQVAAGYQPESINGWLRVLKAVQADACADQQWPNPLVRVAALPLEERLEDDPNALTEAELRDLLAAFECLRPRWYPLVTTIALTGLRWGEATALVWDDLDRGNGVIRVRRAQWRGKVKATKTKRPRKVPLTAELTAVLDRWRAQLVREQHPGLEASWCFPSDAGGPHVSSSVVTKPLRVCLAAAGLKKRVTTTGLRRSVEDVLRRLGVAGPVAEAILGHNRRMRQRYSTVAVDEVANVGPRLVRALGFGTLVGDRVGDRGAEKENAQPETISNRASSM